jgi:hypothetical protein
MDFCLLDEVYPDWTKKEVLAGQTASPGCTDLKPVEKEKKEHKKRSKKCKDPALKYLNPEYQFQDVDPDRQFVSKGWDVLPMNQKTGVVEARPFGTEGFQTTSTPPQVPGPSSNYKNKLPSYFTAGCDEETTEGFQSNIDTIGNDPAYKFAPSGILEEIGSAVSSAKERLTNSLPYPSLNDMWKPLTPGGVASSYFHSLPPPGGVYPTPNQRPTYSEPDDLKKKLDLIFERLNHLEQKRTETSQKDILVFVGSGLVFLFSIDFLSRK